MCKIQTEDNKDNYCTKEKKSSRAMRREAEQEMNDLCDKPNNVFKLVKFLKKEGQDLNDGQYLRGINGKFAFSKKD